MDVSAENCRRKFFHISLVPCLEFLPKFQQLTKLIQPTGKTNEEMFVDTTFQL